MSGLCIKEAYSPATGRGQEDKRKESSQYAHDHDARHGNARVLPRASVESASGHGCASASLEDFIFNNVC